MSSAMREYTGQDLCVDLGDLGHVPIPKPAVFMAVERDDRFDSGYRILDRTPNTDRPIVICDPAKIAA
jgi:hypothetical protein